MTHLKKKKKIISEAERGGVTPCKVREFVRSRARTRGLVGLMLSFLRRCLWAQVGDVWRGETEGRQAREEARRRSRVRGPGREKGVGRESSWDGWPGRHLLTLAASIAQAALAEVHLPLELFLSHIPQRTGMPEKEPWAAKIKVCCSCELTVGLRGSSSLHKASP